MQQIKFECPNCRRQTEIWLQLQLHDDEQNVTDTQYKADKFIVWFNCPVCSEPCVLEARRHTTHVRPPRHEQANVKDT